MLYSIIGCSSGRASDGSSSGSAGLGGSGPNGGGSGVVVAGAEHGGRGGAGAVMGGNAGGGSPAAGRGGAAGSRADGGSGGAAVRPASGGAAGITSEAGGEAGMDVTGGSGGSSGTSCRRYASDFTYTSSGTFKTLSCVFDRPSLTMTCTSDAGDVTATTWRTIDDAVRENDPVGAIRADVQHQTIAFTAGECRLTRDYQYDGSGRLSTVVISIDPDAPCGTTQAVYDDWDSDGRPKHGIEIGVGGETCTGGNVDFTYDDTEPSVTTVHSGGTDCLAFTTVVRYDEDGIVVNAGADPSMPTSTNDTLATAEICE